jgi:hypothetical protein
MEEDITIITSVLLYHKKASFIQDGKTCRLKGENREGKVKK